jgi:hypothetical protein
LLWLVSTGSHDIWLEDLFGVGKLVDTDF